MGIRDQIRILKTRFVCRLKNQSYDVERDLIRYDRNDFRGVALGLLHPAYCPLENLLRCHYVTSRNFHNGSGIPPFLYWHKGWLICVCRELTIYDQKGYALAYPFMCFTEFPKFQPEIKIPSVKPEAKLQIIKVNQPLLRDSFESLIEEYLEWKKRKEKEEDVS